MQCKWIKKKKKKNLRPDNKKQYKVSNATSTLEEEALNTKTVIKVDNVFPMRTANPSGSPPSIY